MSGELMKLMHIVLPGLDPREMPPIKGGIFAAPDILIIFL